MFIGLNPSTADEVRNDPTVRRCIEYSKAWGYAGLCMTNLFAYRATDPEVMKKTSDPIGPDNDQHLIECARRARVVVAAWGDYGTHLARASHVAALLDELHYLKLNKTGQPTHPLYLPKTLRPSIWLRP
jgi:hypothetical protein